MKAWRALGQYWYVFALLLLTCLLVATMSVIAREQQYEAYASVVVTHAYTSPEQVDLIKNAEEDIARRIADMTQSDLFWERIHALPEVEHNQVSVEVKARSEGVVSLVEIKAHSSDRDQLRSVTHAAHRALMQSHTLLHGAGDQVRVDTFDDPSISLRPNHPSVMWAMVWAASVWCVVSIGVMFIVFALFPVDRMHKEVRFTSAPAFTRPSSKRNVSVELEQTNNQLRQYPAEDSYERYIIDHDYDQNGVSTMEEVLEGIPAPVEVELPTSTTFDESFHSDVDEATAVDSDVARAFVSRWQQQLQRHTKK